MKVALRNGLASILTVLVAVASAAADWPQFRGPGGSGASDEANLPLEWSDSKNLAWKTPLSGPGASSPIVWNDRIYVTCYSGYGVDRASSGNMTDLKRHLLAIDLATGNVIWSRSVDAVQPEDPYGGMGIPEHGYASNTPVTDGQRVYVFFGKSGVLAFDLDGNQLWQTDVGRESSNRRWGSAASLVLYKDKVIVNASEESQSIRALDKTTGKEGWKAEASSLDLVYATPALVEVTEGRSELVLAVPYEVWGLDPDTGKLLWYAETSLDGNISPSPVARDGIAYILGGFRQQGSLAIRAGGKDDVTGSHVLWTSRDASYIPSPVLRDGKLYWVDDQGLAYCANAATGKTIYRERLEGATSGGRGKPFYASVLLAGDRLYAPSRTGGTFVLAAEPEFEVLAHNRLESDASDFNASPVPAGSRLLLRSNRFLYCIEER